MLTNHTKGILWILLAAVMLSVMSALVKITGDTASTAVILLGRFACSLIWVLLLTSRRVLKGDKPKFKSNRLGLQLLRTIFGTTALACIFLALKDGQLIDVSLLSNTFPLFVPLVALVALRVKTSLKIIIAMLFGFAGVAIVLGAHHLTVSLDSGIALFAGFSAACSIVTIRRLSKIDHVETTMFYYYFFGFLIALVWVLFDFHLQNMFALFMVVVIGVIGTIYQIAFTYALHHAPARTVTPLMYLSVIFSGILGWAIWHHVPGYDFYIGMLLIIGSAVFAVMNAKDNVVK